jgi:DNA-directed RNA polymerase specialized sigma24 family protein
MQPVKAKRKTGAYYIDNKRFYEEMKKYKDLCKDAEETGDEYPRIPNYLGECFYKIATKLSNKPNFMGYSYKEEMIGDGIENCIHYIKSFNPEKSTNPFSYFTQIVWHSFVHRIQKEKKQQYIRYKAMNNMVMNNEHFVHSADDAYHTIVTTEFHENTQLFISNFEEKIERNKKKKEEKKALENFIED